jgi:hypothetical protein
MDSTFTADRRGAHVRVGAAAIAAFVVLLLLFAVHGSAATGDPAAPVAAPTVQPQQAAPSDPDPGFRRHRGGFGPRGNGGGEPDFGGGGGGEAPGGVAPAPNTDGNTT